ncbi:hypothetical protein [Curtobacterium herbarum]|uniref:DUF2079 domain-containing protein n=1 Tax=Curtobacterium herbarum TaxID=150122 RepID=A0ABN1ZH02_9MICO|nr:hypothetical protein [Curtobacterium herbarum]MBM7475013.1 hypothetical protein [Curtobacterium herbarum]MCS6545656.1 hypothetical protein [Curtobacterium herbarum]
MRRPGTQRWAAPAAVLVGVLAAAVAWVRLGPEARGTGWAEDIGLFFRERLELGAVESVVHPYAGYLHVVPRLVVDVAFLLPVEWYVLAVSAMSCLLVGAVCGGVWVLARDVVPSWPLRLVLAAVPVLLPTAPWEVSGTAANLHTFGLFLAPWLVAHRVRTWWGAAVLALVTVLVVGSETQAVVFLPLLVLAWSPSAGRGDTGVEDRRRGTRWRALPVTLAAVGTAAAQIGTALTTARASAPGAPTAQDVAAGWALQTVGGLWTADVGAVGRAVVADGWAVVAVPAVALLVVVVLGAATALRDGHPRRAVLTLALALGAAAVWTAALVANASADGRWSRAAPGDLVDATPSRYAAAAGLLLCASVVVAAAVLVDRRVHRGRDRAEDASGRRRRQTGGPTAAVFVTVGWSVVTLLVASWVGNVPGVAQRASGPTWQPQFVAAERTCARHPSGTVRIRALPWSAEVPCSLVLRDR